jgi:hypothetical protein
MGNKVETLILEGQDSKEFAKSFFHPSNDEIRHFKKVLKNIDKNINISETENGFCAEVKDLDLSFLH